MARYLHHFKGWAPHTVSGLSNSFFFRLIVSRYTTFHLVPIPKLFLETPTFDPSLFTAPSALRLNKLMNWLFSYLKSWLLALFIVYQIYIPSYLPESLMSQDKLFYLFLIVKDGSWKYQTWDILPFGALTTISFCFSVSRYLWSICSDTT